MLEIHFRVQKGVDRFLVSLIYINSSAVTTILYVPWERMNWGGVIHFAKKNFILFSNFNVLSTCIKLIEIYSYFMQLNVE